MKLISIAVGIFLIFGFQTGTLKAQEDSVATTSATSQSVTESILGFINKLISFFANLYHALDNWLDKAIGFNFTKLIALIVKITLWFLKIAMSFFKWLFNLVF